MMDGAVFVFGSNLAGRHGKGAAKHAREAYGAIYGVGEGRQGMSYAIPTKCEKLSPLPWGKIHEAIGRFVKYAAENPTEVFMLTPVGTGLAGHSKKDLVLSLRQHGTPDNVFLTSSWLDP